MTTELLMIAKIRAMSDPAEVDKQLESVRKMQREITSLVDTELANARQWLNSSSLPTPEDLDAEIQQSDVAYKARMTQRALARLEEELIQRKQELIGKLG